MSDEKVLYSSISLHSAEVVTIMSKQALKMAVNGLIAGWAIRTRAARTRKQEHLKVRSGRVRRRETARIPTAIANSGSYASRK